MSLTRYRPSFSELYGSSLSTSPSCKKCARKRWLLSTEGLLAAGGIWFGTRVALKGQSEWIKTACTTGALCICLANSVLLHFPSTKPNRWGCMLTGGILSGAGIGWCLTVAFKEQPKSTIIAYLAGAISICLTNSIMFHVPSCYESIQKVSKSISLKTDDGNSQTRVTMDHDSRGRPTSLTVKDVADIFEDLQSGGKQYHKCRRFVEELVYKPDDGGKRPEESLAAEEATTLSGLQRKIVNSCERKENIGKKSSYTGAEVDESICKYRENTPSNVKFSASNKIVVQSKQRDMVTSGRQSENVSEFLESHQQIEMQTNLTIPTELNIPRNSDETAFKFAEKAKSARDNAQKVSIASRFIEMGSIVRTSGVASNVSSPTVVVVPKEKDNCSGDEANEDEAVRVKSISIVTDHSQKSEDLSTSESPSESAKGEATINQSVHHQNL